MKFQTFNIDSFIEKIESPVINKDALIELVKDKDYLKQAYIQSKQFKELFLSSGQKYSEELAADLNTKNLKMGDLVTFTNDFGVSFINLEVIGFDTEPYCDRYVYLNWSSYWFAAKMGSLTVQEGLIGLTEDDLKSIDAEFKSEFAA